jgi:hypothetical protein
LGYSLKLFLRRTILKVQRREFNCSPVISIREKHDGARTVIVRIEYSVRIMDEFQSLSSLKPQEFTNAFCTAHLGQIG